MSRLAAVVSAAILIGAAPLLLAIPASAETAAMHDPRGDVRSERLERPRNVGTDVTRLRVRHTDNQIVAVMRFNDLRRVGTQTAHFVIRAQGNDIHSVSVSTSVGDWPGTARLSELYLGYQPCPGLRHQVSYDNNFVRIAVPKTCLLNETDPRTVEVASYAVRDRQFDIAGRNGLKARRFSPKFTRPLTAS